MDLQLKGKTCLVTGASKGIGKSCAELMAAEGAKVAVVARRGELLKELADEIAAAGHEKPVVIAGDVTTEDERERICKETLSALGSVGVLINSAGGSRPTTWDVEESFWEEGMNLNFTSLRRLTTMLVPQMLDNKWGRVINITGTVEPEGVNAANAAKSAVHAWAKGLSRVVAKDGITVNSISPGRIHSEQIDERRHPDPKEREDYIKKHIPIGYFGQPEDLACLAVFLSSPVARYITGELFHVDGGKKHFAH